MVVSWGLEQSRYFTQSCDDLVVVTNHKPLVKILCSRTIDELNNSRIYRLKQRTLPWYFEVAHLPGKTNTDVDATSRHPSQSEYAELTSLTLCSGMDSAECAIIAAIRRDASSFATLSWERIAMETSTDPGMCLLVVAIEEGFPDTHRETDDTVVAFWMYHDSLCVSDRAILYQNRVVIPSQRGTSNSPFCLPESVIDGITYPFDPIPAGHTHRHSGDPRSMSLMQ